MGRKTSEELQISDASELIDQSIYAHISRLKSRAEQNRKFNKKNEEIISSLMSQNKSMLDELKSEHEKKSQSLVELLRQSIGQGENSVRNATAKFHELREKFWEDKTSHQQAYLQALNAYHGAYASVYIIGSDGRREQEDPSSTPGELFLHPGSLELLDMKAGKILVLVLLCCLSLESILSGHYEAIFNFGDSLSDTGNFSRSGALAFAVIVTKGPHVRSGVNFAVVGATALGSSFFYA